MILVTVILELLTDLVKEVRTGKQNLTTQPKLFFTNNTRGRVVTTHHRLELDVLPFSFRENCRGRRCQAVPLS